MNRLGFRSVLLLCLMLSTAVLAHYIRPTQKIADHLPALDLQLLVPDSFGDWRELKARGVQIVDPGQQQFIDRIYSQTLTRTYQNSRGDRVMLSIAYGEDQRDGLQLHKPEVCYPAQGFRVFDKQVETLQLSGRLTPIPVTRLQTVLGGRHEPVTYWTTIGDYVYTGMLEKKYSEIRYGLAGQIPDGMLVRISSIDIRPDRAYELHSQFAKELYSALPDVHKHRFAGIENFSIPNTEKPEIETNRRK